MLAHTRESRGGTVATHTGPAPEYQRDTINTTVIPMFMIIDQILILPPTNSRRLAVVLPSTAVLQYVPSQTWWAYNDTVHDTAVFYIDSTA